MKKAIVLFSGGLDSTTTLALAKEAGYEVYALTFDYGQRHALEIKAAKKIIQCMEIKHHKVFKLDMSAFQTSGLLNHQVDLPDYDPDAGVTNTYVPARNTIFLSIALGFAQTIGAEVIYFGGCQTDHAGFPDTTEEYVRAFENLANIATATEIKIKNPLVNLTKAETIQLGLKLGVNYDLTLSCYQPDKNGQACGHCQACGDRARGFAELAD